MENNLNNQEILTKPIDSPEKPSAGSKKNLIIGIVVGVIVLALVIFAIVSLFRADLETTSRVRDIFIIFMALESLVLGVALIILITQLAVLINIMKNEIKPILENTQETVNTLKGTTTFISNNLAEPVIKLNGYLAGLKQFFDLINPGTKKSNKKS
jgi:amino acid permease